MKKKIFYEGQAVGCLIFGEGKLTEITDVYIYVDYGDCIRTYNSDGSYFNHSRPILYPIDQYREIIANIPAPQPEAWKPKPGEWCWFFDNSMAHASCLRRYKGKHLGLFQDEIGACWDNCTQFVGELPDHLKNVP